MLNHVDRYVSWVLKLNYDNDKRIKRFMLKIIFQYRNLFVEVKLTRLSVESACRWSKK